MDENEIVRIPKIFVKNKSIKLIQITVLYINPLCDKQIKPYGYMKSNTNPSLSIYFTSTLQRETLLQIR